MAKIRLVNNKNKDVEFEIGLNYQTLKKAGEGDSECLGFIMRHPEIPEDFDWKFYINSSSNLINLNCELHAKYNYLTQGKKRNREYSARLTKKWIFPNDFDKVIELSKKLDCVFSGSFVDFLYLEYNNFEIKVLKDIDVLFPKEKIEVPDLILEKCEFSEDFNNFSKIHNNNPAYLYKGHYKNKTIEFYICRRIRYDNFIIGDATIKIEKLEDRISDISSILKNKEKFSFLNENWFIEKLNKFPEVLKGLQSIK